MSAFAKLRETPFSATEKRIADYILRHSDELRQTTIGIVAERCHTSKSMVVRLCKTAGFNGYKDLCSQLMVERALEGQARAERYQDVHPGCTAAEICRITMLAELRSLQDTYDIIDVDRVERAVALLCDADRIQLLGVGGSGVAALDLYNKLTRVGLNARYSMDTHCQLLETASLTARSVAVVISYNGRTKDMLEGVALCRAMGAKVVAITRFGKNPLSDAADVTLPVASNESLTRVTAMSSRLSTLMMVDLLFACLASRMSDSIQDIVKRNTYIAAKRRK